MHLKWSLGLVQKQPLRPNRAKMAVPVWIVVCCFVCIGKGDTDADAGDGHPSRELHVSELDFYVDTAEGRAILEKEFEGVEGGKRRPWTEAEKEENLWKNRYSDLLAYDETRVRLPYESGSDYINANYIDGYHSEKEYVATQGPLPNTTQDFWAMVWHLNVQKIVMLANLVEHGESKVAQYWPTLSGMYGGIMVTRVAEVPFPKFQHVLRVFVLHKAGVPRVVRQLHYTGWPDLGVPDDTESVVALMRQARRRDSTRDPPPILVHCSAGVGRTGTVILLDSMLERAAGEEGVVDFPKRLDHMRVQRVDMVEKKEQYVFAHRAVRDVFSGGNKTAEYVAEVDAAYRRAELEIFGLQHPFRTL